MADEQPPIVEYPKMVRFLEPDGAIQTHIVKSAEELAELEKRLGVNALP